MDSPEKGHPGSSSSNFHLEPEDCKAYMRIDGVPKKIERLGQAKARTKDFLDYACGLPESQSSNLRIPGFRLSKMLEETRHCADDLVVRRWPTADHYGLITRFCHRHLLCMVCAIQRGSFQMSRAMQRVDLIGGLGNRQIYMLTLTVKNGPDLAERYDHLVAGLRFMQQARRSRKHATCFKQLSGGMFSYEFKRGNDNLWHPHVHMLVTSPNELAIEQRPDRDGGSSWRWPDLSREWHRATGDSYIVECHPVYQNGPGGLNGALCEVFKYAVKVNELQHSDRLSALQILYRKRLLGTFGEFYGVGIDSDPVKQKRRMDIEDKCQGESDVQAYRFDHGDFRLKDFWLEPAKCLSW